MSFLDTTPADIPLDMGGPWEPFRTESASKVQRALQELKQRDAPLVIGSPGGPTLTASLWSVDPAVRRLRFNFDPTADPRPVLQHGGLLWAVAYHEGNKIQFEVAGIGLNQRQGQRVLESGWPPAVFMLRRRGDLRVRMAQGRLPSLRLRHPQAPEHETELRVLDIGLGGLLLRSPPGAPLPALEPGLAISKVECWLDDETVLVADIVVRRVTPVTAAAATAAPMLAPAPVPAPALRVGCSWVNLAPQARHALEGWMHSGRRRRELVSLAFE